MLEPHLGHTRDFKNGSNCFPPGIHDLIHNDVTITTLMSSLGLDILSINLLSQNECEQETKGIEQETKDTPSISLENAVKDLLTYLCKKDQATLRHRQCDSYSSYRNELQN